MNRKQTVSVSSDKSTILLLKETGALALSYDALNYYALIYSSI